MRTHHHSLFVPILTSLIGAAAMAMGRGADSPWFSAAESANVGFLAIGARYDQAKRNVKIEGAEGLPELMSRSLYGSLSCDVASWLTIAGGAGQSALKIDESTSYGDEDTLWMAAIRVNLWGFPLTEPAFLTCHIRFDADLSYWQYKAGLDEGDADWNETRGALVVSAERYAENWDQNPAVCPYSLVFYAGCVYSQLDGKIHLVPERAAMAGKSTLSISEDTSFGLIGGIDLFISHNLSIGGEVRAFDDVKNYSYTGSLVLHF